MSINQITIDQNTYVRRELDNPNCEKCDLYKEKNKDSHSICALCIRVNPENSIFEKIKEDKKTYFQLLRELGEWQPKQRHITSDSECQMLKQHFGMDVMNRLELRNLRDFCVSFYHAKMEDPQENLKALNTMMSITSVIDKQLTKQIY